MKDRSMQVEFQENEVSITFAGKQQTDTKEHILFSLEEEIASKGFIVNRNISRENIGDFIYYQFIYFDGKTSRNVKIQVPKKDSETIYAIDKIRTNLDKEMVDIEVMDMDDIFEEPKMFYKDINNS